MNFAFQFVNKKRTNKKNRQILGHLNNIYMIKTTDSGETQ